MGGTERRQGAVRRSEEWQGAVRCGGRQRDSGKRRQEAVGDNGRRREAPRSDRAL